MALLLGVRGKIDSLFNRIIGWLGEKRHSLSVPKGRIKSFLNRIIGWAGGEKTILFLCHRHSSFWLHVLQDLDKMCSQNLQPGMPAPQFILPAVVEGAFRDIRLKDYCGKYVVLLWYPEAFSWVCPTEIIAYDNKIEDFRKEKTEVLCLSCDSANTNLAFTMTARDQGGLGPMTVPLLSDKTGNVAKSYGIYKEDKGVSFRGTFIIDPKGILRQITVNDFSVGRNVDETLRLIQAFKFTDEFGDVCPANWKPGEETIETTRDSVGAYLAKGTKNSKESKKEWQDEDGIPLPSLCHDFRSKIRVHRFKRCYNITKPLCF